MTDPIALIRAALDEAAKAAHFSLVYDPPYDGARFTAVSAIRAIDPAAILRRVQEEQK
jgi:hypothetical protein